MHDLRHAGNVLIANAGADPRELMERRGHSTSRAALVYLHSTSARQRRAGGDGRIPGPLRAGPLGFLWHGCSTTICPAGIDDRP